MDKIVEHWTIAKVREEYPSVNFPEYQREPTVWSLGHKRRLIDSIARRFDIGAIYFYRDEDGSVDCIDGRQRLGAIMSFLGDNPKGEDNKFAYKIVNEIFSDTGETAPYMSIDGRTFEEITASANGGSPDAVSKRFVTAFMNYPITVVMLSKSHLADEFSLQFARLNFSAIINSGELLNAMVGQLRDFCFLELGKHAFFATTNIPTRRFATQQVAAQVVAQFLSWKAYERYTRTRHSDLMLLFKSKVVLTSDERVWLEELKLLLDTLQPAFENSALLRNRALTVSVVLFAARRAITQADEAKQLAEFVATFLGRLKWEAARRKGFDRASEYDELMDFQRDMTQASVEPKAVNGRATVLSKEFDCWLSSRALCGDAAFRARTGTEPGEA